LANKRHEFNCIAWSDPQRYIHEIAKDADAGVKKGLDEIDQKQTDEIIHAIYAEHKDNPKIKWKDSIKKVVGIKKPPAQGDGIYN